MEKGEMCPIKGRIEQNFLEYLVITFNRWQDLADEKVTLGTREIAKFENVVMGAKLNSCFGFETVIRREISDKDNNDHYTLLIYKNQEMKEAKEPLFIFDTRIHK